MQIRRSIVLPWLLAFMLLSLAVPEDGGTNAMSRMCTLRAMSENFSFEITRYKDWTFDWAKTPDGRYYSNKAPGPMLLGFPVYFIIDRLTRLTDADQRDGQGRRPAPSATQKLLLSFFMQVLPACLLMLLFAGWFRANGYADVTVHFFTLAVLFGNTVSLFYNNYFGHAFVANCLLAMLYCHLQKRPVLSGLFFGLAVLSEYSAALLVFPIVALHLMAGSQRWNNLGRFVCGGLGPAVLFFAYHYICFGSPVAIANQFQNPDFVDLTAVEGNIGGIFSITPNWQVLFDLLLSPERGILFTQPWLLPGLLVAPFALRNGELKHLALAGLSGFLLLLYMNASFGGWHGGMTAGPRYLSIFFPVLVFITAVSLPRVGRPALAALAALLFIAIILRSMIYTSTILAPITNLWSFYFNELTDVHRAGTRILRFSIFWISLLVAGYFVFRRQRTNQN